MECVYKPTLFNPQLVDNKKIMSVAMSSYHTLLLAEDGQVYSCGLGRGGKLGLGNEKDSYNDPCLINNLKDIKYVECSDGHSIAYNSEKIYTWGEGYNGRLGHGIVSLLDRACGDQFSPKEVKFEENITNSGCGDKYTMILSTNMKLNLAGNLDNKKLWHKDDLVVSLLLIVFFNIPRDAM